MHILRKRLPYYEKNQMHGHHVLLRKAVTGGLWTNARRNAAYPDASPICERCDAGVPETMQHRMWQCHANLVSRDESIIKSNFLCDKANLFMAMIAISYGEGACHLALTCRSQQPAVTVIRVLLAISSYGGLVARSLAMDLAGNTQRTVESGDAASRC